MSRAAACVPNELRTSMPSSLQLKSLPKLQTMDLSTWNRHGLIVKPAMEFAYLMAQIQIVQGQILDPKEQQTVRLFVSVFSNVVFRADDDYQIIPQLAPDEQRRKACDFAIEYTTDEYAQQILCFVEAKRPIINRGLKSWLLKTKPSATVKSILRCTLTLISFTPAHLSEPIFGAGRLKEIRLKKVIDFK
ncbi:unnamed protein product [Clonostachys byssicola]|uniref:Uncharacterized protein n=1 Tax=Clonostachys byssicola TaxID=160290 RepID=A0A9N9UC75_9HYPO|nr:unnamed protein product [Clonostachys byssicola]